MGIARQNVADDQPIASVAAPCTTSYGIRTGHTVEPCADTRVVKLVAPQSGPDREKGIGGINRHVTVPVTLRSPVHFDTHRQHTAHGVVAPAGPKGFRKVDESPALGVDRQPCKGRGTHRMAERVVVAQLGRMRLWKTSTDVQKV